MLAAKSFQSPQSTISSNNRASISTIDRAVSPNRAKITQLSEKLSNMQMQVDDDKTLRKEVFETRLKNLQDRAAKQNQQDETKFKFLSEQISKCDESITNEKQIRDTLDNKFKSKDIKYMEQGLHKELAKEKSFRKELEGRIYKATEDKVYQLRMELARQKKTREDSENQNAQEIGDLILSLQEEIEEERRTREEQNQNIIAVFGEQVLALQEVLTREKRFREEAQSQMFKILDEMNQYLNQDVQQEKAEREYNEEIILRLLDQTCNKVEQSLRR